MNARRALPLATLLPLALLAAACGATPRRPPLPPATTIANEQVARVAAPPDAELFPATPPEDLPLGPGDIIRLRLWGDAAVSGDYPIGPDGTLTIPLAGDVRAAGATRAALAQVVRERLARYYADVRPEVSVASYSARRAYVFGAVKNPGPVELVPGDKLLAVLGKAGGVVSRENERRQDLGLPLEARLIRGPSVAVVRLRELLDGTAPRLNVAVLPDDVIHVPRENTPVVHVMGEVRAPGLLGLAPRMDATEAISLAGGFTDDARLGDVTILRRWWAEDGERLLIDYDAILSGEMNAPVLLADGDIVVVPRRGIATYNYYLRQLTPSLTTLTVGGM